MRENAMILDRLEKKVRENKPILLLIHWVALFDNIPWQLSNSANPNKVLVNIKLITKPIKYKIIVIIFFIKLQHLLFHL